MLDPDILVAFSAGDLALMRHAMPCMAANTTRTVDMTVTSKVIVI